MSRNPNSVRPPTPRGARLDDVDWAILTVLANDARISNRDLARRVSLAPSTCLLRVRRLQQVGVIEGFRAELAPAAVGRPLQALVSVRLQANARETLGTFSHRLADLPGVLHVYFLAGVNDFLVHVAVASPTDLRDFVVRHLSAAREVAATETNLIFEHLVGSKGLASRD